jgi:hypothetical protein
MRYETLYYVRCHRNYKGYFETNGSDENTMLHAVFYVYIYIMILHVLYGRVQQHLQRNIYKFEP